MPRIVYGRPNGLNANTTSITSTNLVATVALFCVMIGGGWVIFQTQFSSVATTIAENKSAADRMTGRNRSELEQMDKEIKKELQFLRERLIHRRTEVVGIAEWQQFQKGQLDRLDRIDKQLQLLESTRPTTGELSAASKSADQNIQGALERIRALEIYLRGDPKSR